ncbi:MAG: hypothetical protein WC606_02205 [Candidatus Absconditabacterales bacterium]|jgi:hypothetical protein
MPLIEILGVPRIRRRFRRKFKTAIREAVAAIPEMKLTTSEVSVLIFREAGGYDGEIHVRFTFNEKDERTQKVRETFAEEIAIVVDKWFPKTNLIEVWGNPFPKENGFHYIRKEKWEY